MNTKGSLAVLIWAHLHFEGLVGERARQVGHVVGRGGRVRDAAVSHARLINRQGRQHSIYGLCVKAPAAGAQRMELPILPPPGAMAYGSNLVVALHAISYGTRSWAAVHMSDHPAVELELQ